MKNKFIITLFTAILLSISSNSFAEENIEDKKELTVQEILQKAIENKDVWKKRLWIDYDKYKEWEWIVFRWELIDKKTWKWISNEKVSLKIDSINKVSTTNEKWIFNMEVKKSTIKEDENYKIELKIDWYKINKNLVKWKSLIKDSIYHFKINKEQKNEIEHVLKIETVHNKIFNTKPWFQLDKKIIETPSIFWIQWLTLALLILINSFWLWYLYFINKFNK